MPPDSTGFLLTLPTLFSGSELKPSLRKLENVTAHIFHIKQSFISFGQKVMQGIRSSSYVLHRWLIFHILIPLETTWLFVTKICRNVVRTDYTCTSFCSDWMTAMVVIGNYYTFWVGQHKEIVSFEQLVHLELIRIVYASSSRKDSFCSDRSSNVDAND